MTLVLKEIEDEICTITLNRVEKHNAMDDVFTKEITRVLKEAIADDNARILVIKANGRHFSAGADLAWMQRMVNMSEEENFNEAMLLAHLLHILHTCPKPTITMVHGSAFGGGAGLAAASDICIASTSTVFCFPETRLGLIPAMICPYVMQAIGERIARALFITAEPFDAHRAHALHLVQHCVPEAELLDFTMNFARKIKHLAPEAVSEAKRLIEAVRNQPLDDELIQKTAKWIARIRVSKEAQIGMRAFLDKKKPEWNH